MPNRKKFFDQPVEMNIDTEQGGINIMTPTTKGAMQIPFSTGTTATISTTNSGAPDAIMLSGFGSASTTGSYRLTAGTSFPNISGTFTPTNGIGTYFRMPCDATLDKIYFTTSVGTDVTFTATISPFVVIATAIATNSEEEPNIGASVFTIQSTSQVISNQPFLWGGANGRGTTCFGSESDINYFIPKGTLVAIVCGIFQTDRIGTPQSTNRLNFSGGLQFY